MVGPCGCRCCGVLASWVRYLLGSSAGQVALSGTGTVVASFGFPLHVEHSCACSPGSYLQQYLNSQLQIPNVDMLFMCRMGPSAWSISNSHANLSGDVVALWQVLRCFGKLGALPLGFLCGSGRLVGYWLRRGVLGFPLYMSCSIAPAVLALAERRLFHDRIHMNKRLSRPWLCHLVPKPHP